MNLKIIRKYRNNKYGEVYSVSLKDNSISNNRKNLRNMIGREFNIGSETFILRGFSAFWDGDKAKDDKVIFVLYKVL